MPVSSSYKQAQFPAALICGMSSARIWACMQAHASNARLQHAATAHMNSNIAMLAEASHAQRCSLDLKGFHLESWSL